MESTRILKKDWVLTREAFDGFLASLAADREQAGEKYEVLRLKLIKYFEWQDSLIPEDLADETINRVARKIWDGEVIQNLSSYIFGTARHLASEHRKELLRARAAIKHLPDYTTAVLAEPADYDRMECCETCLIGMSERDRDLIIQYYSTEKGAKIDEHKRIANELGVSLNSMRIRIHRIKLKLERCIADCEAKRSAS